MTARVFTQEELRAYAPPKVHDAIMRYRSAKTALILEPGAWDALLSGHAAATELGFPLKLATERLGKRPSAAAILAKARAILTDQGWVQGSFSSGEGHCLEGALRAALWPGDWRAAPDACARAERQATEALSRACSAPKQAIHITTWNDAPGRTLEQVLELINGELARLRPPPKEKVKSA